MSTCHERVLGEELISVAISSQIVLHWLFISVENPVIIELLTVQGICIFVKYSENSPPFTPPTGGADGTAEKA